MGEQVLFYPNLSYSFLVVINLLDLFYHFFLHFFVILILPLFCFFSYTCASGWITHIDPYGWFQWYCKFYQGNKTPPLDTQMPCHRLYSCQTNCTYYIYVPLYCTPIPISLGRRSSDDERQISRGLGVMGAKGRWRSSLVNKCLAAGRPQDVVDKQHISPKVIKIFSIS